MRIRYITLVLCFFALALPAQARIMDMVSDLITASAPSIPSTHRIRFTLFQNVPPGGTITITPEDGAFTIPPAFDYTDVDVAVWNGSAYIDRSLAVSPSATEDGVMVVPGTSGSIRITLSSSQGLLAGDQIEMRLGTNATFGAPSGVNIVNPNTPRSYTIRLVTADSAGNEIDYATPMIAVVEPVTMVVPLANIPPTISGALPTGELAPNSKSIEITFSTDRTATCRYSLVPNTPYASMTDTFSPTKSTFFFTVLSGFQNGTSYTYYVRCIGIQGAVNTVDFPITFSLAASPISDTSVSEQGAQIGTGNIPNGSDVLYQSSASLSGLTSPGSTVQVLKDGVQAVTTQAGADGSFHADITGLERGTYSFAIYSIDSKQRKSASFTSTLAVGAGTSNTLSNIVLPPTLVIDTDQVAVGEKVHLSGSGIPNSAIDVSFILKNGPTGDATHAMATTSSTGVWDTMATGTLKKGTYQVKAKQSLPTAQSDFSSPVYVGIGQSPSITTAGASKSDINGDGKVNLVDFSILLSSWGKSDSASDLNADGVVNLADFSILLFNWTG